MAEIEMISENKLRYLAGEKGLSVIYIEKDFFLTVLLYIFKNIKGIYLKGGTALNKIFLNHTRLSEDLDFSSNIKIKKVKKEVLSILPKHKNFFTRWVFEKQTNNFFRLKIFYRSFFDKNNYVVIDVNTKATIILPPQSHILPHFYKEIPKFKVRTLSREEIVAEKVRALITRNQPRDYFDVYVMLKKGIKINQKLVKKKIKEIGEYFSIERIFKNAKKIYSKWDKDIGHLTNKPVKYITAIKALQKEFGYKEGN